MEQRTAELQTCPNCGAQSVYTEPELDEDEVPTGELTAICAGCGRTIALLPQTEPSREGEPWSAEEALLPVSEDVDLDPRPRVD